MAVKDDKVKGKGDAAPSSRNIPKKPRRDAGGPRPADAFNGYAFAGTVLSWILLLIGQRVLDAEQGASTMFTGLGVVGLVVCFGQRVWATMGAPADRRASTQLFAALSALGLVALALYAATTDWGRDLVGMERPKVGQPDDFGEIGTVVWVALLVTSLLPSILGELARRSMLRAERVESRRVIAAVVSGVALSFAMIYGSLFTYTAGKMEVFADFSYFRVAKPSESTARMIDSLDEPLKIRLYFPTHSEVRTKVERYFQELGKMTPKVEVEALDRLLVPDRAKEDKVRKDGVIVLQRDQMTETLDIGTEEDRAANTLKKLDGEFQKVLLKAMRDKGVVYLTVGHGELNESTDRDSMRTVRILRQLIESQNHSLKNLGLSQGLGNAVPDDADVVVVLGPTEPFSEAEVESLKRYGEGGGKLLLALDPDAQVDLSPIAAAVGLSWRDKLVVNDKVLFPMKRNESDKKVLVAKRFSSHASVSTLSKLAARGAAVLIPGSAPLDKLEGADKALRIDFAVKSVPGSYVDEDGSFSYDKDTEKKATYNLVAAVSRPVAPSEGDAKDDKKSPGAAGPEMRAFVIGDADVFTDPVMDYAKTNRLLFLEALRWLHGEESFSGEISETEDKRIVHTKSEDQIWFYTAILGVPSLVLGAGLLFTRRRRRKQQPHKQGAAGKAKSAEDKTDAPKRNAKARAKKTKPEPKKSEPEESARDESEPEESESEAEKAQDEPESETSEDESESDDEDEEDDK